MAEQGRSNGSPARLRAFVLRLGILLVIWWILSGTMDSLWFGLPLSVAAAAVSLWLTPPARFRLRLLRFPAFAGFFLWQSLLAGWDVARRTLAPGLPLHPEILRYGVVLPPGAPTWWLMLTISLLPGTLSVRLHPGQDLEVHCLDTEMEIVGSLRQTETWIARLYGIEEHSPTATAGR